MSKEAQRQAMARKQRRNAKAAKWTIIGLLVMVVPLLLFLATQQ